MSDYSTLALRISASVSGIRGCLLLSRDGSVLGADPEGEMESHVKSSWVRFAAVGEADRSYIEFPDQTWAFVRRGAYAAFAVADADVRPGVIVDLLEQALMSAEQERMHDRDAMRLPDVPPAKSRKPRTRLHQPERPPALSTEPETVSRDVEVPQLAETVASNDPPDELAAGGTEDPDPNAAPDAEPELESPPPRAEEETEVDRILLAKEFAGLLQVPKEDDEASR